MKGSCAAVLWIYFAVVSFGGGGYATDVMPDRETKWPSNVDDPVVKGDPKSLMEQLTKTFSELKEKDHETRKMVKQFVEKVGLSKDKSRQKRRGDAPQERIRTPRLINNGTCYFEPCERAPYILQPGQNGQPGAQGERGTRGDRGPKGDNGLIGPPGSAGTKGDDSSSRTGDIGEKGRRGHQGSTGRPGVAGSKGGQGEQGDPGDGESSRTVYTRWGRNSCGDAADLVYEGYAAGAAYNQKGGGANYVCLPRSPHYRSYQNGVSTWRAYMYGAEYEVVDFPPFYGKDNGDVPCAVCSASGRSVTIMQPARIDCPSGWTREYYGYLMAQAYIYYRSEWACVDHSATLTSSSSTSNSDGALFYPTEVCCGNHDTGLPCADYPNGHELTCAVCTR